MKTKQDIKITIILSLSKNIKILNSNYMILKLHKIFKDAGSISVWQDKKCNFTLLSML